MRIVIKSEYVRWFSKSILRTSPGLILKELNTTDMSEQKIEPLTFQIHALYITLDEAQIILSIRKYKLLLRGSDRGCAENVPHVFPFLLLVLELLFAFEILSIIDVQTY
jgi:hypothetical protein